MSKPKLFDDYASDSDVEIKTSNDYATYYNTWREKEEFNKLKTKYGDRANFTLEQSEDDSSSSEDDEDGKHLTEEFEKDFFKTLSYLKVKDPKIYDDKVVFFEKIIGENESQQTKSKSKKHEPMFMKDYERKMILEKGAKFEDSDEEELEEDPRSRSPTYVEEQRRIKENLKKAVDDEEDNDDEKWGGLFQKRQKTKEETEKDEVDYTKWLKGNKEHLENEEMENELRPLKEYWNRPDLKKSEAFLRDYLLNKRYLEKNDENHIPTYEEIIHDSDENLSADETNIEKQEEFEVKYNFRYEEPDQEFIKRYPRTMDHSVRKTDDRRKVKREEIKHRKDEEKKEKQEDLKQLKILKRKEIEEKIKKIKEITGNEQLAFQEMDIDGDFDPEEHDRRMQEIFNNQYYEGEEGDQKPEFSDFEEELGPWKDKNELHCEDEDFNMDCDYNPTATKNEKKEKKKRNRAGKSSKNKNEDEELPIDENDDRYGEYMDELYKLDYEHMIGDIPCRFKYRDVVPNDFGLSVEEILVAKDKELNRWCSLKKTTQYRPEQAERYDVIAFRKKAENEDLKRKCLPSLYEELDEELNESTKCDQNESSSTAHFNVTEENIETEDDNENIKSKEKNFNKNVEIEQNNDGKKSKKKKNVKEEILERQEISENVKTEDNNKNKKSKEKDFNTNVEIEQNNDGKKSKKKKNVEEILETQEINENKKSKKKNKSAEDEQNEENENIENTHTDDKGKSKKKRKHSEPEESENNAKQETTTENTGHKKTKKKQKNSKLQKSGENIKKVETEIAESNEPKKLSRRQRKNKKIVMLKPTDNIQENTNDGIKTKLPEHEKTNKNNKKRKLSEPAGEQHSSSNPKKKQKLDNKNKKFKKNIVDKKTILSDSRLEAYGINPKKFKNKLKYKNKPTVQ